MIVVSFQTLDFAGLTHDLGAAATKIGKYRTQGLVVAMPVRSGRMSTSVGVTASDATTLPPSSLNRFFGDTNQLLGIGAAVMDGCHGGAFHLPWKYSASAAPAERSL